MDFVNIMIMHLVNEIWNHTDEKKMLNHNFIVRGRELDNTKN